MKPEQLMPPFPIAKHPSKLNEQNNFYSSAKNFWVKLPVIYRLAKD